MPGFVVTTGTTVMCAHGGEAKATVSNSRVKVMGQPVVTQPFPYVVSKCPNPPPPPPTNLGPCQTANWVTGSLRLKVMGQPLLLQDSQSICTPTGTPLTIIPTQMRVKGM